MKTEESKEFGSLRPPLSVDELHTYHEKAAGRLVIDPGYVVLHCSGSVEEF